MRLRQGVIKPTPKRKLYTWHMKMCILDSNCQYLNVEIMHLAITCLRWWALMWNLKTLSSSKRAWFAAIMYSVRYKLC